MTKLKERGQAGLPNCKFSVLSFVTYLQLGRPACPRSFEIRSYRKLSHSAAVDDHNFAIHETIPFADHERRIFRQFFRPAHPAAGSPK